MLFIPVPNCAQINLIYTFNGERVSNVFHVKQETPYDQTSLAVICDVFKNWWDAQMKPAVPNELALVLIVARALDSESAPTIEYNTGLPLTGVNTSDTPFPGNVTVAVKWFTALRGRSYRGRTYHLGLYNGQISGNQITGAAQTSLLAKYQALLTALESTTADLVVVSRYHNNAPRTTGVATLIQGCTIDVNVDSQRRRLAGRGE